jgi:HAE1 family hydrophobic/amphiphilic exporter-1
MDFTKVLRSRGLERRQAVIQAGRTRLRPIIMTTTAMIFGMLPLALGIGAGGEMRAPMARAVIGGLITSTLLTLLVVPVVYTLLDDAVARLRRRRARPAAVAAALALLFGFLLGPGAGNTLAQAAASSPAVKVLTLDEALAIAATQNRDVQKAREYQKWVRGKYTEERAAALPNVAFNATALRQFDDTQSKLFRDFSFGGDEGDDTAGLGEIFGGRQDIGVAQVSVTQTIFTWGQVGAAIRAARIGYQYAAVSAGGDQGRLDRVLRRRHREGADCHRRRERDAEGTAARGSAAKGAGRHRDRL